MIIVKKPKIRFKGFTETWEQRKLSEIALQTYGGGTPKTANEEFWKGNIPWIQSSDLIEERLFNVKPRKYISQEAISKSSTKLVPQNSITIVTRVGVGKLAFMPFSYATSQDFLSLSELKIEPKFAVYALYKMMRLVSNEVQGTSIKGITKDELLAKEILIPDCEVQKKIGAYLHNLDNLITLHQRKCENLKKLKKFMLQKLFPQNGENVPKIRFTNFTDTWEQRKLGDLTKELSDYATMASGLPLLTSSRGGLMYQSYFRDRKTTTSDETLFSIVPKGSCTYRHMSDDDIFHFNINVLEKGLVSREYPVFISSENNDLEFIIQYINSSDRFRAFCKGQKKGGTRTRLYYKTLCEFEMMIPSIEEQKKISATLHKLDHLITLHQSKCDNLKEVKKYMLQNMFI